MAVVYGVDETRSRPTTTYVVAASILGAVALIAGIATLFTGSAPLLLVLLGALVALWVIATARHALGWWTSVDGLREAALLPMRPRKPEREHRRRRRRRRVPSQG
jgi:hypothetical protein